MLTIIVATLLLLSTIQCHNNNVQAAFIPPSTIHTKINTSHPTHITILSSSYSPPLFTTQLFAKKSATKKKKSKTTTSASRATRNKVGKRTASASGFGGAAVEPCPCGSGLAYMKCCGKLHKDADAYAKATAEQVVRARYSAYAKREVDFIVGSTHPLNKDFITDIEHWKTTIRNNCYDNFELTSCKILSESYDTLKDGNAEKEVATVCFVAEMIQVDTREKTSFMETSTFERAGEHIRGGAWLYKEGVIEAAPTDEEDGEGNEEDGGEEKGDE